MILRLILFELRFWLRQPLLWIFLGMGFAFACLLAVFEGGGVGSEGMVHVNAPSHVYELYANLAFLWLPMVTAFVNATAIRDIAYHTSDIVYSTVVTKRQYVLGRFTGSTLVALLPTLGISLGLIVGSWIPYGDPIRFGPNDPLVHAQAFLWFAVTSILFQSTVMFAVATVVRSTAASFVTSIALVVLNVIATAYATDVENTWLATLLDPFGNQALDEVMRYWSVHESNTRLLPLTGALLWNRLLWLGIALLVFTAGYLRFSFTERKHAGTIIDPVEGAFGVQRSGVPTVDQRHSGSSHVQRLLSLIASDLRSVFRTPVFWMIVCLGLLMTMITLSEVSSGFGNHSWPVTYNVVEMLRGISLLFVMVLITFYGGELVHRDRDNGLEGIMNALPVRSMSVLLSKWSTLVIIGLFVLSLMSCIGVVTQLVQGYHRIQPGLYITGFILPGLITFAFWSMIAIAIQVVVDNKYMGFGLFVVLFATNALIWRFLKIESNLVVLYGAPRLLYSDMNGFGPFLLPWAFFRTYWLSFASVVFFVGGLFVVRSGETSWRWRIRIARQRLRGSWKLGVALLGAWLLLMGVGFYNTRILNEPRSDEQGEELQVAYERAYRGYAELALPHITAVDVTVQLSPRSREVGHEATITLTNKGLLDVDTLWFSLPDHFRTEIRVPGAQLVLDDSIRYQRMFRLDRPLALGDSIVIGISGSWRPRGFGNDVEFLQVAENGTFLNNQEMLPTIGYQPELELTEQGARRKHGLPPNKRMPELSDDIRARGSNTIMRYADHIRFACTIATDPDQIGIAPGTLIKEWQENGKRWFRYVSDAPILNFWAVVSGRYEVSRAQAGAVSLEVFHHPEHETNVPRMLEGMRDAISYATEHFGPYPHKVARIIEFPRYRRFAQSFPATMPYSEAIGFITDLRDTTRIDLVYYVVAHEMAHQWWGHQVIGPRMQGTTMMVESMAQYTALMVVEKRYGRNAMRKFLVYERDNYLRQRSQETIGELPLMKVEGQQSVHYNKGSVVLYMLKDLIGEDRMNGAYRSFIDSFAYRGAPYPTTFDLHRALREHTPDSLRYLLEDGLWNITFYRNAITGATAQRNPDGSWKVEVTISCAKVHADPQGKEIEVPMNDLLDISLLRSPGAWKKNDDAVLLQQRCKLGSGVNVVSFTLPEQPFEVVLDRDGLFFDRELKDNVLRVTDQ